MAILDRVGVKDFLPGDGTMIHLLTEGEDGTEERQTRRWRFLCSFGLQRYFYLSKFLCFIFFKTWLVPYFHISNLVSVNGRLISLGSSFTDRVFTPIGSRLVISGASFLSFQWPAIPTFPHPRPLKRLTKAFREIGVAHWTQTWFYHTSPNC